MNHDEELMLLRAMEEFGGHFAHFLAKAWFHADSGNKARLRAAFGDLLLSFRDFVE